jgi:hypothetical protein
MTLADLLATLEQRGALAPSRLKDCKTSLRYLASALGHATPEQCPVGAACRDPATWGSALETHFTTLEAQGRTISAITRRNTRNNIRVVFRQAETHGVLHAPLSPSLLTPAHRRRFSRQLRETSPYYTTYHPEHGPRHFGLPQAQWPPDITTGWRDYQARCGMRLRVTTLQGYARCLATYFGYLANICGRSPVWEDLFDTAQLTGFVRWHEVRLQHPSTAMARRLLTIITAMARVLQHPARQALADLVKDLPATAPLHTKRTHWVSLATLEAVAEACLAAGRVPYVVSRGARAPGAHRSSRFQQGLILKLLVRVPLRQRNVREMRLDKHLYKDPQTGHWHLEFSGGDLKIGKRQGQVNKYEVDLTDYCPDLIPALHEFLQVHRPRLPEAATSPFLFLTHSGKPFTEHDLRLGLSETVAMRTGQRFYPHLIRTIWATEYIDKTRDFTGAAYMLGDNVATVLRAYQHILGKDQHAKAKAFLSTALQG